VGRRGSVGVVSVSWDEFAGWNAKKIAAKL
jgi:hypothetical protein